jgi:hypothetical protein
VVLEKGKSLASACIQTVYLNLHWKFNNTARVSHTSASMDGIMNGKGCGRKQLYYNTRYCAF